MRSAVAIKMSSFWPKICDLKALKEVIYRRFQTNILKNKMIEIYLNIFLMQFTSTYYLLY